MSLLKSEETFLLTGAMSCHITIAFGYKDMEKAKRALKSLSKPDNTSNSRIKIFELVDKLWT